MTSFRKNYKLIIVLSVLVVLSLIPIIRGVSEKISDKRLGLTVVKVAQFGDVFIYSPLYLADMLGYFKEEGLRVKFISTGGDKETYTAVSDGSALFGIADPVFVRIAEEKGIKGKVIGGLVNGVPFWGISMKDIPQITDGEMLQPYRVATFPDPTTAYAVQKRMFLEAGLKPNILELDMGQLLPALYSKRADIALELEPNVSTAVARGAKTVYSFADRYKDFAFTGISASVKTIEEQPELVQHFINAITKAEAFVHQHPDEAAHCIHKNKNFKRVNEKIIRDAIHRMVESNTLPSNAVISEEAWMESVNLRLETGDLSSALNAEDCLDMSFAIKAKVSL